jgi:phosphoribosylaminoimidazolecarboxamide formyltransferase/IMP cyclohydrolase
MSVFDKSGIADFAQKLLAINPDLHIFSTGNTYKNISDALGAASHGHLSRISDYTGQPEMQGGLVKTLDFKIYLGLLSEPENPAHKNDIRRTGAVEMDMVVVNLYPFSEVTAKDDCDAEDARSNIDIGGPCMLRAAAKNYIRTAAVCTPADYKDILSEMRENGGTLCLESRHKLAAHAFAHTAEYDTTIARYFSETSDLDKVYTFA